MRIFITLADLFVPPELRDNQNRRRSAMRFRGVARMFLIIIATMIIFVGVTYGVAGHSYIAELMLVVAAIGFNLVGLISMRLFRTFFVPLIIANIGTVGAFVYGAAISGGISSPFIFLFLTIPALSISFGTRAVFMITCAVIGIILLGIYAMQLTGIIAPARPGGLASSVQFLYLLGAFTLIGFGGISAQISVAQARRAIRRANDRLADKNQMLEALSSKLAKYLSPQVYSSIFEGKQEVKVGAVRKKLTVYFADIVDFTATTESMEAEDLSNLMNDYFDEMAKVILGHGGTIDKYMGDAIMVFFGDPDSKGEKEDAIACVRMALEMERRLEDLQKIWLSKGISRPLSMRAGINTGYCTVGNFGSENRMDYTIIGGQVNVAARLEGAAKPGQILISNQTRSLVNKVFDCESFGEITVKGLAEPVPAYWVRGLIGEYETVKVIHENLEGLSLFADPSRLSTGDRKSAIDLLRKAADRLEKAEKTQPSKNSDFADTQ